MSARLAARDAPTLEAIAPERLPGLADEWDALWRATPDASPFLAPAWLLPWAEIYAPGRCHAATLWADGVLAALLPVFVWKNALLLAGTGPSDHGGALIRPGFEHWAAALLARAADSCPEPFDRIDLQQLAPDSPLAGAIPIRVPAKAGTQSPERRRKRSGLPPARERCFSADPGALGAGDPCPALMLAGADRMANVPRRMRDNWRYAARRFAREGGVVERVPSDETAQAIAALEALHAARWAERGEDGVFADPLLARLLHRAAPRLDDAGLLRLYRARIENRTIAVLLALAGSAAQCYFIAGFDPAEARRSPGTLLVGAAIEAAAREGAARFDFLRGREDYKYRWGATDRPRVRRILTG